MNEKNLLAMTEAINLIRYCEQQEECCRCVFGQHDITCLIGEPWRWYTGLIKSQIKKEVGEEEG